MLLKILNFIAQLFEQPMPEGSTTCAHCSEPIVPGMPVAAAPANALYPYTHANVECSEAGSAELVGTWGNGKLLTLNEPYDFQPTSHGGIEMVSKQIVQHKNNTVQ